MQAIKHWPGSSTFHVTILEIKFIRFDNTAMPCCAAWSCSRNQKCTARPWQTSAKDDALVSYSRNASKYTFPNASLHPPISDSGRESTYQNRRVRALKRIDFWKDQGTGEFRSMRNTVVGSSPSVVRSKVSLAEQDSGQKLMIDNNYLLRGRRFQDNKFVPTESSTMQACVAENATRPRSPLLSRAKYCIDFSICGSTAAMDADGVPTSLVPSLVPHPGNLPIGGLLLDLSKAGLPFSYHSFAEAEVAYIDHLLIHL